MIKKIIIDNFMAHEHTEMELGAGVTILTGSNNTGKSAVVEALRCLATNPTPSHFIRHGAKEARVAVEMEDGTRVVWVRTKRWAMYELWKPGAVEPEEYHKLQRKVPEDIAEVLRLDMVELETGRKVDIHLGNQREPVFLLNQPDSDTAAFFAASTESAHLLAMQNLLKRRTQDAKREERALEEQTGRILGDIDRLAPLPEIGLEMEAVQALEEAATDLEKAIPALEAVLVEGKNLTQSVEKSKNAAGVLAKIQTPPALVEIRGLTDALRSATGLEAQLRAARDRTAVLAPLNPLPETEDTVSLAGLVRSIGSTECGLRKTADQKTVLDGLEAVPAKEDAAKLAGFMDDFIKTRYRFERLTRWDDVLRKVAEPPRPEPLSELARTVAEMDGLEGRLSERKGELETLEKDLERFVDSLSDRIRDLGRCPTCGHALSTENFLDHGRSHDA